MDNNTIDFNTINFNTGDIILFQDTKRNALLDWLGYFIQYFTKSKYSHVGMVVKDPLIKGKTITGIYLLESTAFDGIKDIEDNKTKFGVQIVPLRERLEADDDVCYYRKLNQEQTPEFIDLYNKAYAIVKDKPYDINPTDWCKAEFDIKKGNVQKTNTFFCSALVSFLLTALNILPQTTDWTVMRPKDLGTEPDTRLTIPQLEKEVKIINYPPITKRN